MTVEGTVRNGMIVLDPHSQSLPDGTRVRVAASTGMEPAIRKTPGVCGGEACLGNRRIPVWLVVEARLSGIADHDIRQQYDPPLTPAELAAAWEYERRNPDEVAGAIRRNAMAE